MFVVVVVVVVVAIVAIVVFHDHILHYMPVRKGFQNATMVTISDC